MKQMELASLLNDMSLEEKIGQMLQITGDFFSEDSAVVTGPDQKIPITKEYSSLAGSVLGVMGAGNLKRIQKKFMKQHPHHIPLLFMLDIVNGYKTIYPIPLAQGAMFEPELSGRCARMAAEEGSAAGIHVTFSPMADLVRDARWGRVMESTGEDVYLNCLYAEAMTKGYQGNLKDPDTMGACIKHIAGYGAAEGGREYNTAEISEHTFREFYLPAYESAVRAGSVMAMTAFNTVNGIPATIHKQLMRQILRKEMGFEGVLISDYSAISETVMHGVSEDSKDAALRALQSGVDIDMMSGAYPAYLKELVEDGRIEESFINESTLRVLELKNKLGLFENPYRGADEERERKEFLSKEHRTLARTAASRSFVLLKNENQILPLQKGIKTAFIGPYTDCREIMGSWSFAGDTKDVVTIKEAALQVMEKGQAVYCQGSQILPNETKLVGFDGFCNPKLSEVKLQEMKQEAVEAAKWAEVVVMTVGEHYLQSGEAASRGEIEIPEIQKELLDLVYSVNPNIVAVIFNGRPLDLKHIVKRAKAVLEVWMPGTEGGHAILDVLTGKYNPSGKLPMSFPYAVGQVPVHYDHYQTGRPYTKESKERYLSKYLDMPNDPLYPFGYGLSYTQFLISPVVLDQEVMKEKQTIRVSVTVENIGSIYGEEVVQLYVRDIKASIARPVKQLKGFQKIFLEPGENREVVFELTQEMLSFSNGDGIRRCEPGEFEIYIGNSSDTKNKAVLTKE